jgi:hypothetical protein
LILNDYQFSYGKYSHARVATPATISVAPISVAQPTTFCIVSEKRLTFHRESTTKLINNNTVPDAIMFLPVQYRASIAEFADHSYLLFHSCFARKKFPEKKNSILTKKGDAEVYPLI